MNMRLFFPVLVLILMLAGCTPAIETSKPAVSASQPAVETLPPAAESTQPATGSTEDPSVSATATIDVDALIREKLANNHSIDRVYNAQKTHEEWNTTLDRMIGYGAKITEEEKQIIIDYLLSR